MLKGNTTMNTRWLVGVLVTGLALTWQLEAQADPQTTRNDDGWNYFFDQDQLHTSGDSPYGQVLRGRNSGAARVLLIRPRAQFVSELLKSVEQI